MRLSTLSCATEGCDHAFSRDLDMWHVIEAAQEAGWMVDHNDVAHCPEHNADSPLVKERWLVGCYTCDFEEEYDNEEDAKSEYNLHECETDPWIWDPARVMAEEERRAARANSYQPVRKAIEESLDRQKIVDEYAQRWVKFHNLIRPWKKIQIP